MSVKCLEFVIRWVRRWWLLWLLVKRETIVCVDSLDFLPCPGPTTHLPHPGAVSPDWARFPDQSGNTAREIWAMVAFERNSLQKIYHFDNVCGLHNYTGCNLSIIRLSVKHQDWTALGSTRCSSQVTQAGSLSLFIVLRVTAGLNSHVSDCQENRIRASKAFIMSDLSKGLRFVLSPLFLQTPTPLLKAANAEEPVTDYKLWLRAGGLGIRGWGGITVQNGRMENGHIGS